MIRILKQFALVLAVLMLGGTAIAQVASAELHVMVKDSNGAVVKGATITVRSAATNFDRTQTQNVEGEYPIHSLPPGHYEVTVEAPGFAKALLSNVTVTVGQIAELPVMMQVAAVSETVNVSSEAEMIETQRSSSATTIEQQRIENLPINGRNYINFALTNSKLSRDTAPSIGAAPTSGLNVSGQRARNNQVNVDGMDAVDNSTNGIKSTVSQDAVQEFQLITNSYAAEYGRASGGIVNIITKGGTNALHGSAFGYLRNRNLQATNPFSTIKDPAYTRFQGGFTIGGPIKKDRTFFFLSYENTRRHESGYTSIGQNNFGLSQKADFSQYIGFLTQQPIPAGTFMLPVDAAQAPFMAPVAAQFNQLLAAYAGTGNAAYLSQAKSLAGAMTMVGTSGVVATTGVNPFTSLLGLPKTFAYLGATTPLGGLLPLATPASYATLNSLVGNFPIFEGTSVGSLRLDHSLTRNQQLNFRVGASPSTADGIQVNGQGPQSFGQSSWSRSSEQQFRDFSISAQHNWTIGSTKVNELRYQFSRRGLLYTYSRSAPGASNVAVNIPGVAFFGREPFSFVQRVEKRNQFTDNFTWTVGKHTFKFGGDVNYLPLVADFTVNFGGIYNFGSVALPGLPFQLDPVQAYGAGLPQNFIQGVGNPHDEFSNKTLGVFGQDSWRITHNLTLNYGVRYDVEWSPTFPGETALQRSADAALGVVKGIPRDYNNFAPRAGFAWDPMGNGKTVVRGAYGIFYDHPLLGLAFDSDVADGTQAPQIVLFGGSPGSCAGSNALNAGNTFTGFYANCGPASALNFLGQEQRFNPAPNAPTAWANQGFLTAGPGGGPLGLTMQPFGFPTGHDFVYSYANQVNFGIERDLGHNMALSVEYNFAGGRHLNRPINVNAVHTDLLVQNWKIAMNDPNLTPAQKATFAQDPRFVTTPTGLPLSQYTVGGQTFTYVIPATVSFFRPSGVNIGLIPFNTTPSPVNPYYVLRQYLNAVGIPDLGPIPFSDMPSNLSSGSSVYHGLTTNLRKRFAKNYEFLASYTWSHAIDDSTDLESPLSPQNNYNPSADRSNSLFDQRHRFVFSGVYKTGSLFKSNGFAHAIFSDWTFAPIIEVSSGRPFNIVTGVDSNYDFGTTTDRPMIASSAIKDSCGNTAVASKYSPGGFFIPACFIDGTTTGNLKRNAGTKPYTIFNDLRVARDIRLGERFKMEGIVDIFNIANKFNVADVNPIWNQAGQPTAAFDPRQFQLALRITF
jgi:hypothetical protein